jgi:SAM-dependent methyltransferase
VIDRTQLLADLQTVLRKLEADLLERSEEMPEVSAVLTGEHRRARQADRTAQSYEDWRSDYITQIAAAWVLSCVFVRFLEDNRLVDPPRIAGLGERLSRARDEHELYFRVHLHETDREYLLHVFDELARLPGTKDIFGTHNPVHELPNWLSGDAAGELLRFFQKIDANTGALIHDFTDPDWNTRFLGDLYQDLSEEARKKHALLQTPEFVEELILDRTFDPAIEEFGLEGFRMIDPACGSGHFLLGSFVRLLDHWLRKEPNTNIRELIQRALNSVYGVDVNPYAVAIARFRLLLAAMKACEVQRLANAPAFHLNLACGDSLLHGAPGGDQQGLGWQDYSHVYQAEDLGELRRILIPEKYHLVIANPPYITPKDKALNEAYRERYFACHGKYSLAVPFCQRVLSLAVKNGFTGQITANSFMKREFGKKLIEEFFPRFDLTHVIDTSLAHIPQYGTPTVILLIRNRHRTCPTIRAALGIRRENVEPVSPSKGKVWSSILSLLDTPGSENDYISVEDVDATIFAQHPWSVTGGGATELKDRIDCSTVIPLSKVVDVIGVFGMTNADEVMLAPRKSFMRKSVEEFARRRLVIGDDVRDWAIWPGDEVFFPYRNERLIELSELPSAHKWLWICRTTMGNRATFAKSTYFQEGRPWWEWHQVTLQRLRRPLTITNAFVATHNHYVLDCGGSVFNRSAPIIKLKDTATKSDHYELLAALNSSVGAFWMRQVFHDKGGGGVGGGIAAETWERFLEYDGTKIKQFPIPIINDPRLANELDTLAQSLAKHSPSNICFSDVIKSGYSAGVAARSKWNDILQRMIVLQEELDWECYRLYGLIDHDLTYHGEPPSINLGQRAFEIVMARKMTVGELETTWFERHGSMPITELPTEWPENYRQLIEQRIELIETERDISLIEQPEYKRRWNTVQWEPQLERVLQNRLLDRLESYFDFDGRMNDEGKPTAKIDISLISTSQLTDVARQDADFMQVGELYCNDPAFDVHQLVTELVEAESVPLLPILRYQPSGLRKRREWEQTWDLQRQEDAIDARAKLLKDNPQYLTELQAQELKRHQIGDIPVPPKYTSSDFASSTYWRLRGKLDVPKERWVSFPHCEGTDGTLMIAWAGYDHLQLARAISTYYVDIQERLGGRDDPRLVPLLACLIELLPWLKQWHNDVDPEFGMHMGDYFEGFTQEEARQMGKTLDQLREWEPPKKTTRRRKQTAM